MSSIVPGPKKKLEEDITAARAGDKPLDPSALNASALRLEPLTGLEGWPASLRSAIEAEYARVSALDTNRRKTADRAVPAVAEALDALLAAIADRLGKPRLFGKAAPAAAPSPEIAELLGIPADELDVPTGRGDHRTALRTVKQLRSQLKDLESAVDHDRLTRLSTFTIRLATVVDGAPDAAGALVPIALARFAAAIPDKQWNATFAEKVATWQAIHQTLGTP